MSRSILFPLFCSLAFAWDQNEDLLSAARKGDLSTVQALIQKGADVEAKTAYGQTPLFLASMNGHTPVVAFLLEKGARTDVRDTFYKAGLIDFALQRKHYAAVQLIIEKGGLDLENALPSIVRAGSPDLMKAAIATGKLTSDAMTKALELAWNLNKPELAGVLTKAGAKPPEPGVVVEPKILESYAGTYKSQQFPIEIKAWVRDSQLVMQVIGQPEFVPKAKSATLFAGVGAEFEFDAPNSFVLRQAGQKLQFKKVAAR
ncbi:MAG TPA: ankyrin repeat domain-containing protein [Bryobacteraceae bacterium]|nr:ankyrin repeat domain-containing protein [Bryobacteraceae bacterium]